MINSSSALPSRDRENDAMPMTDLNRLSATEARTRLRAGTLTAEALLAACLERIRQRAAESGEPALEPIATLSLVPRAVDAVLKRASY
jgi:Asp-tRNA(Asn)/Glu-tRNA(Gln) amidotransferase A subunit family amidase